MIAEIPLADPARSRPLIRAGARVCFAHPLFSPDWLRLRAADPSLAPRPWKRLWAITDHERLRLRALLDAVVAELYQLEYDDLAWILRDCDHPAEKLRDKAFCRTFDPKGFWRVDKDKDPELRHTVLTLAAFRDLTAAIATAGGDRDRGIEAFCAQNDGDGWMLPEALRLADLGLGHDDRAKALQPVRAALGERFLPWQLEQAVADSWAECERHAKNILGEDGYARLQAELTCAGRATPADDDAPGRPAGAAGAAGRQGPRDLLGQPLETNMFGEVVERTRRKGRR